MQRPCTPAAIAGALPLPASARRRHAMLAQRHLWRTGAAALLRPRRSRQAAHVSLAAARSLAARAEATPATDVAPSAAAAGADVLLAADSAREAAQPLVAAFQRQAPEPLFRVVSQHQPAGDQPTAIASISARLAAGDKYCLLEGATGTVRRRSQAWGRRPRKSCAPTCGPTSS